MTTMTPAMTMQAANDALVQHHAEASRLGRLGMWVLIGAVLPAGLWMGLAPITSAVVAPAAVKVDLNRRPVQHAEGGIVREVLVRDGQQVKQGQPLLVLGDVAVDADRQRLDYRVMSERASEARLLAEQTMAGAIAFPPEVLAAARTDASLNAQVTRERMLFAARRDSLYGQLKLLNAQRDKVEQEIAALKAQIARAVEALQFQRNELDTHRRLAKDGFISAAKVNQLEGGIADYGVKLEERRSDLARAEQRRVDIDLRMRTLESEYRQTASDQLKQVSAQLSETRQEQRKSADASTRQVITAPADGEVMDLKFSSVGAVIPPRETIADIVPSDTRLLTEARIRPEDITRVQPGQGAEIRFTAYKYRSTKLVDAKVVYVSADRLVDRATGQPYYVAQVEADRNSLAAAGDLKLQAGMPAEVYITGDRHTPFEYLMEPVLQVLRHAGRER